MNKTIILLSHVTFDNTPYCSYVHSHAKALAQKGYQVIVFAVLRWFPGISILKKERRSHYRNFRKEKIIDNVKVVYVKSLSLSNLFQDSRINLNGFFYYLAIRRKVKKIMKQEKVVLIDAHTFKIEGYVASKLKEKYSSIPAIVTCHGTSFLNTYKTPKGRKQIKRIAKQLDCLVCVSEYLQERLNSINIKNTKVISNGIDQHEETIAEKRDYNSIITLGSLIERKNIDLVIEAFNKVYQKNRKLKLTIIGEGILKETLIKRCENLGISDAVKFKGQILNQEVHELMKKHNIFVLPSVREGFGICYVEAMSNGCIAIGTKGEGIDGFIKDGINGFLVNTSIKEIETKIEYILSNEKKCEIIRNEGRKQAKELTWDRNATEYLKLIE